jgi:ribonuclease-3 family protein
MVRPMADDSLRTRSIRTLAWLGDAEYERQVRWRVAARGDYPTDRLDTIKAAIVRADAQAALLARIEPSLSADELAVVRRGRNAALPISARGRKNTQAYRASTAFEALVAHWTFTGAEGAARFDALVGPELDAAVDEALTRHATRPRRG